MGSTPSLSIVFLPRDSVFRTNDFRRIQIALSVANIRSYGQLEDPLFRRALFPVRGTIQIRRLPLRNRVKIQRFDAEQVIRLRYSTDYVNLIARCTSEHSKHPRHTKDLILRG